MRAGVTVRHGRASVIIEDLISRFELSNLADGKSQKTIWWYGDILKCLSRYLKESGQPSDIASFTIDNIRKYILHLAHRSKFDRHPYTPKQDLLLSPQTIRAHVRGLKAFSSWLHREKYTKENRLQNLRLPKAPIKIMEPLTQQEIEQIISNINKNSPTGFRNYAIFVTALDNGLRALELANITLGQLNLKAGYIKVMGKGSKERIVPIGEYVRMTLWHYIDRVRPKPAITDCDNLFLSRDGKPITVNTIKLVFSRLARSSGVARLHAHLCRHTFAIDYLLNGGDIFSLREILGHTTLEMVNHYLHFTNAQLAVQHHKYSPMDKFMGKGAHPEFS